MTPVLIQQLTDARTQGVLMGKLIRKIREEATGAVDTSDLEDCCPRWRATYDLLLAQLFEMESRTANYVRAIDSVGELKKTTNQVLLGKPMLTRVSTPAQQEAVERFAKADEDYAGTPWGYRAELERKAMHTIDSHQYRASPPISCWLVERTFLERPTSARRSSRTLRAAKQTSTGW